ncbi:YeiH family protein [Aurantiacibacter gangjinensis]|uniref:Uncharacterized protein n=1 Tax=Aurantiacibacter gangjinensis TaxID=502682 RepID=A0A0G9MN07_9SPHN|nr:putative sulfate exporter family transporter [Aurantiacibacter gangjinensis]APE28085.1 Inner membrane protein [Aurantiacibacter gangjinensis]KLE32009.1 hypothetical protein AAW01_11310 [Aurantiacibacter gangjinensis]
MGRGQTGNAPSPAIYAGDLYCEYYIAEAPVPQRGLRHFVPGILLCGTAALAAAFLAGQYAFPVMVLGLLIGLALSFAGQEETVAPGLDLAATRLAQVGIALLGLQVSAAQVTALGWGALAGLLVVMAGTIVVALLTARLVGESRAFGLLAGGATAICGASAAVALYGAMGRNKVDKARFTLTLVGVAVASAIAMTLYPSFAGAIGLTDTQAGFLIGASVHDAAQAIGGGFAFSDEAGANATVTKLARVAMLGPLVALTAIWLADKRDATAADARGRRLPMPWFVAAFLLLAIANSALDIPAQIADHALDLSKALLLLAVVAIAMRSRPQMLLEAGWRTLAPVAAASLTAFALATAATVLLVGQ